MDLSSLTFVAGAEQDDGSFVLATQVPELGSRPHSGMVRWTEAEGWTEIGLAPEITAGIAASPTGDGFVLMDPRGHWVERQGGTSKRGQLVGPGGEPLAEQVRALARVGDALVAGTTGRMVFARTGAGGWHRISSDAMHAKAAYPTAVEDVAGIDADELCAVGWKGELWCRRAGVWRQVDSPTDRILNAVAASSSRYVATGLSGVVVEGRGDAWRILEHDATDSDFWGVAELDGVFYLSARDGIYQLRERELTRMPLPEGFGSAYGLVRGPSGIWSIGSSTVARFDGHDWRIIGTSEAD